MKKLLLLLPILLLTISIRAQADLPDRGTVADLKGKSVFYLQSDAENRKYILKRIDKQKKLISETPTAQAADFFIEYKTLRSEHTGSLNLETETGQMDVYFMRGGKKVLAWSDSATSSFSKTPSMSLTDRFLKEYKKIK